jgi:nitroreductase
MHIRQRVVDLIQQRVSCRTYTKDRIAADKRQQLAAFLSTLQAGPLGAPTRFSFVAATEQDSDALRGLGTYGTIRNPAGFLVGAVGSSVRNLEDYGHRLEEAILFATDLGLATCWLGGFFTKSGFAARIDLRAGELLPAVASVGYAAERSSLVDRASRLGVRARHRFAWDRLFFDGQFGAALTPQAAGPYAVPLEMVRLAPSASNRQPWRIVRDGKGWHFFLQRTPVYGTGGMRLVRRADLQRVDMGIAMCHFALTAEELGLDGGWRIEDPLLKLPALTEYRVSWTER